MPNPKTKEQEAKEQEAKEQEAKEQEAKEPETTASNPGDPYDLKGAIDGLTAAMTARMDALETRFEQQASAIAALANQDGVEASIDEEEDDAPEIDLESIGRVIGDW